MSEPLSQQPVDLSVDLAGLRLSNPMLTASGTCGYAGEYADFADLSRLGAFVTKSITPEPRKGNPPVRIVETRSGMLNAIGLANIGLERFVAEKLPACAALGVPIVVNVAGHSIDDYLTVCRRLEPLEAIAAVELNVSCPNVDDGLTFGTVPALLDELVSAVRGAVRRLKLVVKLSQNVTDIAATARAAVAGGADALSLVNTFVGMAIDPQTWRCVLANRTGGLSGPAIKPMALAMVHRVYEQVARPAGVPVIGMGGICTVDDAVEFLLAGATGLAVGTALFVDPATPQKIADGLADYLRRRGLSRVTDLVGKLQAP